MTPAVRSCWCLTRFVAKRVGFVDSEVLKVLGLILAHRKPQSGSRQSNADGLPGRWEFAGG